MSAVAQPGSRLLTAEDLWAISARGERYELIQGELRDMPPANPEHGYYTMSLGARVQVYVEDNDLGAGFAAETGFIIARNPDTVLAPDFAFIAKDRLPAPIPKKFAELVPELVLETGSPADKERDIEEKVRLWLDAGVRMVWELDLSRRVLTVHRPGAEPRPLGAEETLSGEDVLPGFSLPLSRLFR